jgi:hypothetical protein
VTSVNGSAKLLLVALADMADKETGQCYPATPTLAAKIGASERQTQRLIDKLSALHLIAIELRVGTSSLYTVLGGDTHVTTPPPTGGDTGVTPVVTPMSPGGDTHVTPVVTPMSPKPLINPLPNPSSNRGSAPGKSSKSKPLEYPLDYDWEMLMPIDYQRVPELKLFAKVTGGRYPPHALLGEVVQTIRTGCLSEKDLSTAYRKWVWKGFKTENLGWLSDWAPAVKKGEQPWEFKRPGGQAETVPKPRQPNQVSPEQSLKDLLAGQNAKPSMA